MKHQDHCQKAYRNSPANLRQNRRLQGLKRKKGTDEAAEIFKSETESRSHAAEPSKGASSKSSRSNRSPSSSGSASRSRSVSK